MERDKRAGRHGGTRHGIVHPLAQIGAPVIKAALAKARLKKHAMPAGLIAIHP